MTALTASSTPTRTRSLVHRNLDLYADFRPERERQPPASRPSASSWKATDAPNDDLFWNLDVVETGPETRDISLSVDWQSGGGCYFSGPSNTFQGELTQGSCVIPTPTGHVYFQLEKAARYQTGNTFGVGTTLLEGRWMEVRNGYLLVGHATLYARQHDQNSAIGQTGAAAPPAVATYRDPFAEGGSCVHAGISGTGTLAEGEPLVCGSALEYQGDGFDLYVDDEREAVFCAARPKSARPAHPGRGVRRRPERRGLHRQPRRAGHPLRLGLRGRLGDVQQHLLVDPRERDQRVHRRVDRRADGVRVTAAVSGRADSQRPKSAAKLARRRPQATPSIAEDLQRRPAASRSRPTDSSWSVTALGAWRG